RQAGDDHHLRVAVGGQECSGDEGVPPGVAQPEAVMRRQEIATQGVPFEGTTRDDAVVSRVYPRAPADYRNGGSFVTSLFAAAVSDSCHPGWMRSGGRGDPVAGPSPSATRA